MEFRTGMYGSRYGNVVGVGEEETPGTTVLWVVSGVVV